MRGGGDRHGAELRRRGTERVGGLQEMPALHAAATLLTLANVHMERADDRADRRQVFLVLRGSARELEGAATVRTRQGQCGGVGLIDRGWLRSSGMAPICRASPPPRVAATTLRTVLRKRRGLAKARPAGRIQLLFEVFVLTLQLIAVALGFATLLFRARQFFAQARDLMLLVLDQIVAIITRRLRAPSKHICVMPYPRNLYKYDFLDRAHSCSWTR